MKMNYASGKWAYSTTITDSKDESRSCQFKDVTADSSIGAAAKLLLQALALMPDTALTGTGIDANYGGDYVWANNAADERCPCRGGSWSYGGNAGVFDLGLSNPRSNTWSHNGGRCAFVKQ